MTHQGASADSGHYTSYVKKQGALDPKSGKRKGRMGSGGGLMMIRFLRLRRRRLRG